MTTTITTTIITTSYRTDRCHCLRVSQSAINSQFESIPLLFSFTTEQLDLTSVLWYFVWICWTFGPLVSLALVPSSIVGFGFVYFAFALFPFLLLLPVGLKSFLGLPTFAGLPLWLTATPSGLPLELLLRPRASMALVDDHTVRPNCAEL